MNKVEQTQQNRYSKKSKAETLYQTDIEHLEMYHNRNNRHIINGPEMQQTSQLHCGTIFMYYIHNLNIHYIL